MLSIMKKTAIENQKHGRIAYGSRDVSACCLVAGLLWGGVAMAAPPAIVVNSLADPGSNDTLCTLREAIMVVEGTDQQTGCALPKGKNPKITFAPGLTGKIMLNSTLNILKPVTIEGPGADKIVIDAAGDSSTPRRAFEIHNYDSGVGMLNLSGVWVQNGYAGGDGGGAFLIYNPGASLKLSNCIVSNSTTTNPNGGGAILVREGTSATIDNCVFFKNSATNGEGGAINVVATPNNDSSLAVTNSKFFDNESASWGSAIFTVALGVGEAGTITTASTSIDTSEFYDNSAQNPSSGGGAIANWGIAAGANATTSVSNSLVGGNVSTNYSPGGIYNLASNTGTAMMTVTDSSVVANTSPGGEESGMDILSTAESGSTATLNVSNSTVFDCLVSAIGSGSNPGTGCP